MMSISRIESDIEEIGSLCNDIKEELSQLSFLDTLESINHPPQTFESVLGINPYNGQPSRCSKEPIVDADSLNYKKLKSRCDSMLSFVINSNLISSVEFQSHIENIFQKSYINDRDVDNILFLSDELSRAIKEFRDNQEDTVTMEQTTSDELTPKIFISHSTDDKEYVQALVELLEDMGIGEDQLFCSSMPEYGIPLNEDIYEYLKKQFQDYNIQVIFMLSNNYYKSVACLNEMGAAWILQNSYTSILVPDFEFQNIKGAINPNKISIKLGSEDVTPLLNQLKENYQNTFGFTSMATSKWERHRSKFIEQIANVHK